MAQLREQAQWQCTITQYILDAPTDADTKRRMLALQHAGHLFSFGIGPIMTAATPAKIDALIHRIETMRARGLALRLEPLHVQSAVVPFA